MEKTAISSATPRDPATDGAVSSSHLKLAEDFIHTHLNEPISLLELTAAAGTSPSTLLRIFNAHRGVSPMRYVRRLRLEAVRRTLEMADPSIGIVSRVATDFGFRQLGRFSAQYRNAFGELPTVTLRRNRQPGAHEV